LLPIVDTFVADRRPLSPTFAISCRDSLFPTVNCLCRSHRWLVVAFSPAHPAAYQLKHQAENVFMFSDDHGVRWGDTGRIIAQWRRPMASRVALDLPYLAMRLAPYHLIRMAIEMASKAAAFFSVVDYFITVAK
jgi:hypothetical protein